MMNNIDTLNKIIAYLEDIKNSKPENLEISYLPEILEFASTCDGTYYGKKHLNIDITFKQLYTKKDTMFGSWELYDKN